MRNKTKAKSRQAKAKTAEERGMEMMSIPMNQLPPIAHEFAKRLCKEVGMCMEVLLTAWTVYAQCVENLPCEDDLYRARPDDIEWFKNRLAKDSANVTN